MNLIETLKRYQNKILDSGILIEYSLFFDKENKDYCKFAIDEENELNELNNLILKLREKDIAAEIYVNTYNINFAKENIYIYADTLWVNSKLDVKEICNLFRYFQNVEPSDITSLDEDVTIDGEIALVVSTESIVEDYRLFIEKRQLNLIKSLYWD